MLPADSPFASPPAPGPHPATAELRAYAAGTLPAADEHRIEAHTLDCERCAELLDGFSMSDTATTDQALAQLRARLQTRVADDLAEPILLPASRPLWPRLAAAVALLGAVGAGIWGWEQRPAAPAVATVASPAAPAPASTLPATPPAASPAASPAANELARALPPPPSLPAPRRPIVPVKQPEHPPVCGIFQPTPTTAAVVTAKPDDYTIAANDKDSPAMAAPLPGRSQGASEARTAESAADVAELAAAKRATPQVVVAAAPPPAADSSAGALGEVVISRFSSKAKAFESTALVRDKPMPTVPAIAPAPIAGTPALRNYLYHEATKFEPAEGERRLNGSVRLRFVVGADGKLSNLQVVRGLRADYDEEALRLICEGPAWRPGIANGRRADLPMEVTVLF